jgi:ABC-type dipeptide/oligopeptide/nickel transport system ATPase component
VHVKVVTSYAHDFSGGRRRRIAMARAPALRPEIIVADKPVSALGVSAQAQILKAYGRCRATCRFHTRCPLAADLSSAQEPPLRNGEAGHAVACRRPLESRSPAVASPAHGNAVFGEGVV